jgi:hypothetical protein
MSVKKYKSGMDGALRHRGDHNPQGGTDGGGALIEQVFREQWGRVLAALVGYLGDFDLAEDAAQEAFGEVVEPVAPETSEDEMQETTFATSGWS